MGRSPIVWALTAAWMCSIPTCIVPAARWSASGRIACACSLSRIRQGAGASGFGSGIGERGPAAARILSLRGGGGERWPVSPRQGKRSSKKEGESPVGGKIGLEDLERRLRKTQTGSEVGKRSVRIDPKTGEVSYQNEGGGLMESGGVGASVREEEAPTPRGLASAERALQESSPTKATTGNPRRGSLRRDGASKADAFRDPAQSASGAAHWAHVRSLYMGRAPSEPWDVAVGPDGMLYIADSLFHRLVVMHPKSGYYLKKVREKPGAYMLTSPTGVVFNDGGQLCIADTGRGRVLIVHPSNFSLIRQIGSSGIEPGQFTFPYGLHAASGGDIWVTDTRSRRVQRFSNTTGQLVFEMGASGPDPFKYPNDSGRHRIRRFDLASGNETGRFGRYGQAPGEFFHPGSLAVRDHDGLLFVSDVKNHRVQVFRCHDFSFVSAIGDLGDDDGCFQCPSGLCVDKSGQLWVCDRENHRLQLFREICDGVELQETPERGLKNAGGFLQL